MTRSASATQKATAIPTGPDHRTPAPGDTVKFMNEDAIVIKVRPTKLVDLATYGPGGRPVAHDRVAHDPASGWRWPEEATHVPRPRTLDERLDEAEAAGRRVPRVGMIVKYIYDVSNEGTVAQDLHSRRARITRVVGLDAADLEVFASDEPPLDPDDEDAIWGVVRNVGHYDPSRGYPGRFAFLEDGFVPPGRQRLDEARPRWRCARCNAPADPGHDLALPGGNSIHVCRDCHAEWCDTAEAFARGRAGATA
jgi:hypothetical protein